MVTSDSVREEILRGDWALPDHLWDEMSDAEREFLAFELGGIQSQFFESPKRTRQYYLNRLKKIGFNDQGRVLDAGCGIGQWSLTLSQLGNSVIGIDPSIRRLQIGKEIHNSHGVSNSTFVEGSLESLPFADSHFDATFCYGVLMFTNIPKSLRELARVTRPGGRIYINCNSFGWGVHMVVTRGIAHKNMTSFKSGVRMLWNTFRNSPSYRFHSAGSLSYALAQAGFSQIRAGREGEISVNPEISIPPGYPTKFFLVDGIVEALATRSPIQAI